MAKFLALKNRCPTLRMYTCAYVPVYICRYVYIHVYDVYQEFILYIERVKESTQHCIAILYQVIALSLDILV